MNSNVGAWYWPATRPLATFGAWARQASRTDWSNCCCGAQSERATTRIVRVGWLSRPIGAFVARRRARCGWAPVNCVVMPPVGLPVWFSPVISHGVIQRFLTAPERGSTSTM